MSYNKNGLVKEVRTSKAPFFTGFSTVGNHSSFTLTNIDLVKRDIQNHFATPMGSRVMLPRFGTRIYDLLFDPFDEYTKNAIIEDAITVIGEEPRVDLVAIDAYRDDHALTLLITLLFKPEQVTNDLYVTFSLKDQASF